MTPTQFLFLLKNAFFRYYFHRMKGAKPSLMEVLELIEAYTEIIKEDTLKLNKNGKNSGKSKATDDYSKHQQSK